MTGFSISNILQGAPRNLGDLRHVLILLFYFVTILDFSRSNECRGETLNQHFPIMEVKEVYKN